MTVPPAHDLDKLEALNAARTAGPWDDDPPEMQPEGNVLWDMTPADYQFVVALANQADGLIAAARQADKLREALEAWDGIAEQFVSEMPRAKEGRMWEYVDEAVTVLKAQRRKARKALAASPAAEDAR